MFLLPLRYGCRVDNCDCGLRCVCELKKLFCAGVKKGKTMAEVNHKDGLIQIKLFWPDLTKKAQNQMREALRMKPHDDNNWTYIPMVVMEISEEVINE